MRIYFLICTIFFCRHAIAQVIPFDKYTSDTIKLKTFTAKKIVAYRIGYVTIFMDHKSFLDEYYVFWKRYDDDRKERIKDNDMDDDFALRFNTIDSAYRLLKTKIKTADIVFLAQDPFDKAGLKCLVRLDVYIENGTCAVKDENNQLQHTVTRHKGSWHRGPLNAWGGRRYFLPGRTIHFYQETDWLS